MLPYIITTDHHWSPRAWDKIRRAGGSHADATTIMAPPEMLRLLGPLLKERGKVAPAPETHAYVDAGRWVAQCPFCPSAQVVHPDDPRFLCAGADGCCNQEVAGAYVRIVFPPARSRLALERELLKRPHLKNRNWMPHETLAELRLENQMHGIR